MAIDVEKPTFNLKVVVQETGLKPDTLRVWERRYGLPQPERTAGGHRLYSQQDIDTLKWLVARQKEGMSISRAVELWRRLEAEDQLPFEQAAPAVAGVKPAISPPVGNTTVELRRAWIDACLAFDEQTAEHILTQAFALFSLETACTELLLPALAEIGEGWYKGELTVQQEHFASALATRRLEALLAAAPTPHRSGRLIAGCPAQEEHIIGSLLLSVLLRRQGWGVIYLGANIPLAQLETTISTTEPQLVILSAQQLPSAATLQEVAQFLQEEQIPLAFGGAIFNEMPALRQRIPGHFLGENLNEAPQVVEHLLAVRPPTPQIEPLSEAYQQALTHYRQQQPLVDAAVWEAMRDTEWSDQQLRVAGNNLSDNIIAALTLGNMDFLKAEIMWVRGLLDNYRLPTTLLHHYLNAHHQAVETQLDERCKPITDWLAQVITNVEGSTTQLR